MAPSVGPQVRQRRVALQRRGIAESTLGAAGGIVVEGRDIGTVVWPEAPLKVFLTADPTARATRRNAELTGTAASVEQTQESLARRDRIDSGRTAAPLLRADDAVLLDTTELTLDEAVQAIVDLAEDRRRA